MTPQIATAKNRPPLTTCTPVSIRDVSSCDVIDRLLGAALAAIVSTLHLRFERQAVEPEVGRERAQRRRAQHRLGAEKAPALAPVPVLELAGAERDEVDRERMPLVADDRRRQAEPRGFAIALVRRLLLALQAALIHRIDQLLLFLQHAVEEVDHPLRVQQRVEAVVAAATGAASRTRAGPRRVCSRTDRRRRACGAPGRSRPRCRAPSRGRAAAAGSRSRACTPRARTRSAPRSKASRAAGEAGAGMGVGPVGPRRDERARHRRAPYGDAHLSSRPPEPSRRV